MHFRSVQRIEPLQCRPCYDPTRWSVDQREVDHAPRFAKQPIHTIELKDDTSVPDLMELSDDSDSDDDIGDGILTYTAELTDDTSVPDPVLPEPPTTEIVRGWVALLRGESDTAAITTDQCMVSQDDVSVSDPGHGIEDGIGCQSTHSGISLVQYNAKIRRRVPKKKNGKKATTRTSQQIQEHLYIQFTQSTIRQLCERVVRRAPYDSFVKEWIQSLRFT